MKWHIPCRAQRPNRPASPTLSSPDFPLLMGILNINDDSFSHDGSLDPDWAIRHTIQLIEDGAAIIDAGAESARTNRGPISEEEEIRRLQPLLAAWPDIVQRTSHHLPHPPLLSINTWRPRVMEAVLASGQVALLNDMSGLPTPEPARLAALAGCSLLVMHTVGLPKQNHSHLVHENILRTLQEFFTDRLAVCAAAGLPRESIILDPGLGFAKTAADDLRILRHLPELAAFDRPLLLPISRKGFIGRTLNLPDPRERDAGTMAALIAGLERGAHIFRVHDVRAARQVLSTWRACSSRAAINHPA